MDYDEIADRYARQDYKRKVKAYVGRQNRLFFRGRANRGLNK